MKKLIAIDNRYILSERIKDAGFGIIYKGFDLEFDKNVVAIKEINQLYSKDQEIIDIFQNEIVITTKLRHPNIVNVYDIRVTADKRFYIIMEYIEGIDLRDMINRCYSKGHCFPTELSVYIIGEVCKALDYAHNKKDPISGEPLNIIHKHISPSDIMVTVDGLVKVIDFGVAESHYQNAKRPGYGIMKGKVNYMSPEQIRGDHQDNRSDLFSLGIVMFEVLTGAKLFWEDSDLALLKKIAEAKIDPEVFEKHQIPAELRKIIQKAVQKNPEDRYQSAREMYRDLHHYLQKTSTSDLGFILSEFIQEHYDEEQQSGAVIKKDKIKIDEETEIIKTHSINSDLAKKELQTAEKEPPPLPDSDETIVIKKEVKPRHEVVVKPTAEKMAKPKRKDWSSKIREEIEKISSKKFKKSDWYSKIREEIEKLSFGQVLFNIPKFMKIGKKERIEVRISQDLEADITKKLKGKGTPEIEISKIGDFMKVRLSGDNFKINALNEEEQIVAKDTYTEWSWDVVPLKSKIQVLHFHVTIRIKIEGTEEKRDYPVIDKEVYVKVNPVYSTKIFAVNNWKWILTALIIPLIGWIVRMVLK